MNINRVMIAGTNSGAGKTVTVCAILKLLIDRGLKPHGFKCGPDYIDAGYHKRLLGIQSTNLDSFFTDKQTLNSLLAEHGSNADICIIEGVMGYYDGLGFSTKASSYEIAALTNTPVILLINCKGLSNSVGAMLKGFVSYKENSGIKGVIFNQMSPGLYEGAKALALELGITPLGYIPVIKRLALPSRHLGLVGAQELVGFPEDLARGAEILKDTLDIEGIVKLAKSAPEIGEKPLVISPIPSGPVPIGVAADEAFTFTYQDNLNLLTALGCEIVPFSPLRDKALPEGIQGLLLSGGYPELHLKALAQNPSMAQDIQTAINAGLPTLAECGGFMYLHEEIEDRSGKTYPMCGVIKGKCYPTEKLVRFGYVQMEALEDNVLCVKGGEIKGHEFHYWDSTNNGSGYQIHKASGSAQWQGNHASLSLYAGFPHLYLYGNIPAARRFVETCAAYKGWHNDRAYD